MVGLDVKHRNYLVHLVSRSLTRAKLSAKEAWTEILRELQNWPLAPGPRKDDPMFRRLVSAWVMVGTILFGGSVKAQRPFPADLVPKRTALERLSLERQWFGVVPLVETERLLDISIGGDLLFAQTSYAMAHAFEAESGRLIWSAQLGERSGFARGVAANSFGVYATNADTMFALDKKTGRLIWKHQLGTIPTSSPACDEERAMVGLTTGKIYAFTLKSRDDKGNET